MNQNSLCVNVELNVSNAQLLSALQPYLTFTTLAPRGRPFDVDYSIDRPRLGFAQLKPDLR